MGTKNTFKKSLLSSAILATLHTFSTAASAGTCPPPDASGDVHVSSGNFCEGGITVDGGDPPINDIGIKGYVKGNVLNGGAMADFWMDEGTLEGSFVNGNDADMDNVYLSSGSEIFADIRNEGDMRYLTLTDAPGKETIVHGDIYNDGYIGHVDIQGAGSKVLGDIVNDDIIDGGVMVDGGTVEGNVYNNGFTEYVVAANGGLIAGNIVNNDETGGFGAVNGSTVGGDLVNNGFAMAMGAMSGSAVVGNVVNNGWVDVMGAVDGSSIAGDLINNDGADVLGVADGSSVGGSIVNNGYVERMGVVDGSTVTGDVRNEDTVDDIIIIDSSTVGGAVVNAMDGETEGIKVTDGSTVNAIRNEGESDFITVTRSQVITDVINSGTAYHMGLYSADIDGNVENHGETGMILGMNGTTIDGNILNTGAVYDGITLIDGVTVGGDVINEDFVGGGINILDGSTLAEGLTNNGVIDVTAGDVFLPGMPQVIAGVRVGNGSSVAKDISNTNSIEVRTPPPPPISDGIGPGPEIDMPMTSLAGISVDNGSSVREINNSGSIEVRNSLPHDSDPVLDGATANGIQVINGSTAESIVNSGDIYADTYGIYVDGDRFDGVSVSGNISNEDGSTITAQDNGIYVHSATVGGEIVNAGRLISLHDNGIDIEDSVINGNVKNSGTLISYYDAISIDDSYIGGDVVNEKDANISSQMDGYGGIDIDNTEVVGHVANKGTIDVNEIGIEIEWDDSDGASSIGKSLTNSGTINAGDKGIVVQGWKGFDGPPPEPAPGQPPVAPPIHYVNIGGGFNNTGTIDAGDDGIEMEYVDITGDFNSAGTVRSGSDGIELDEVKISGNVTVNTITAEDYGFEADDVTVGGNVMFLGDIYSDEEDAIDIDDTTIAGHFENHGALTADYEGIDIRDSSIGSHFSNTGAVYAGDIGISLDGVSVGGFFENSGDITAEDDTGILFEDTVTIGGHFLNTGDILSDGEGIALNGGYTVEELPDGGGIVTHHNMTVSGAFENRGTINSEDEGIRIRHAVIDGSFSNSGAVTSEDDHAISLGGQTVINGSVINTGTLSGDNGINIVGNGWFNVETGEFEDGEALVITGDISNAGDISVEDDGIYLDGVSLGGGIYNAGTITTEDDDGISVRYSSIGGDVINQRDGVIDADESSIDIDESRVEGSVINHGTLLSASDEGIEIDDSVVTGNVVNTSEGVITVSSDGFNIDDSIIQGYVQNAGIITALQSSGIEIGSSDIAGNVINNGTITAGNHGFEIDGDMPGDGDGVMTIGGSLINTGDITTEYAGDGITRPGEDGFNLDFVTINGNFTNSGMLNVGDDGFSVDDVSIGGSFVNSEEITAGETGIEMNRVTIGANADGEGHFTNTNTITAAVGDGISLYESTLKGNFVNSGNIDATAATLPSYEEGERYYKDGVVQVVPDGDVVLESLGVDDNGNHWVSLKNESGQHQAFDLTQQENDQYHHIHLDSGDQTFISIGSVSRGEEDVALMETHTPDPEVLDIIAADFSNDFQPAYKVREVVQHGISIVGEYDGEPQAVKTIGGRFENTGDIAARNHGITVSAAEIGEGFLNEGDVAAKRGSAITISDSLIGGSLVNTGTLTANEDFAYQEGESLHKEWQGEPSLDGDIVFSAQGTDEQGNAWFLIRNESDGYQSVELDEVNGDFATRDVGLAPGEEIYLNAGELEGDLTLTENEGDGEQTLSANSQPFTPDRDERRGISVENTAVGGYVLNTGNITAAEEGITIVDSSVGGTSAEAGGLQNSGNITSGHEGILIQNTDFGYQLQEDGEMYHGNVVNTTGATITSAQTAISIDGFTGLGDVVNNGMLKAGETILEDGEIVDEVWGSGIEVSGGTINGEIANNGEINATGYGISFGRGSFQSVENSGSIEAGYNGIGGSRFNLNGLSNSGSIKAGTFVDEEGESYGNGIYLSRGDLYGTLSNSGQIEAVDHGIYLRRFGVQLEREKLDDGDSKVVGDWQIINDASGVIDAGGDGIRLENVYLESTVLQDGQTPETVDIYTGQIVNNGIIQAKGHGIALQDVYVDGGSVELPSLLNTGTITAEAGNGAALFSSNATFGKIVNAGVLTGGFAPEVVEPVPDGGSVASITPGTQVAVDFRDAFTALDMESSGTINGDIHGKTALGDGDADMDMLKLISGTMNGDIYNVDTIDVTGFVSFGSQTLVHSFNNSSAFNIRSGGHVDLGTAKTIEVQGDVLSEGKISVVLDREENNYDQARITALAKEDGESIAGGTATLLEKLEGDESEDRTIAISLNNQDISNLNLGSSTDVSLIYAESGVTDEGVFIKSDTTLVSYEKFLREGDTDFGVTGTVNDLGVLSTSGGADSNASNAIAALQGLGSEGLADLYESNRTLYDRIYNADEAGLAVIADELIASPETGIAAGQAAQNEAVNTILTRIAELRTGASGISAGDDDEASNVRPDSLWIRAIYSDGDQDAGSNDGNDYSGYSLRSTGFTVGADKDISDTLTLGLGVTVANSTANENSGNSQANSDTDTYLGSLYAGWRDQDYFADASLSFGKSGTDLKGSNWETDYDSTQIGLSVLGGKSYLFNNNDTLVEPRVGLNYTRLSTDDYSYTPTGGVKTDVSSQNLETIEVGAGVRVVNSFEVGDGTLLPEASFMAWHDFKADEVKARVDFQNSGSSFTYVGQEAEKNRYQFGAGAEYLMDNNFSVSVNYEHNWQDGFKADTWVAKLRYDF